MLTIVGLFEILFAMVTDYNLLRNFTQPQIGRQMKKLLYFGCKVQKSISCVALCQHMSGTNQASVVYVRTRHPILPTFSFFILFEFTHFPSTLVALMKPFNAWSFNAASRTHLICNQGSYAIFRQLVNLKESESRWELLIDFILCKDHARIIICAWLFGWWWAKVTLCLVMYVACNLGSNKLNFVVQVYFFWVHGFHTSRAWQNG